MAYDSRKVESKAAKKFRKADKLWQIFEIALTDMKVLEESKKYILDMGVWHGFDYADTEKPDEKRRCVVCCAGAVMAQTFEAPLGEDLSPNSFEQDDALKTKFNALNELRSGFIAAAYNQFHDYEKSFVDNYPEMESKHEEKLLYFMNMPHYATSDQDPEQNEQWWKDAEDLLDFLKKHDI